MMRWFFLTLTLLTLATIGLAFAQDNYPSKNTAPAPAAPSVTISGKVLSTDSTSVVVMTDSGSHRIFTLDHPSDATKLKGGDRVTVDYRNLEGDAYTASRVTLAATANLPTSTRGIYGYDDARTTDPQPMPRTASLMPMIALLGAVIVGASLIFRTLARFSA